MKKSLSLLALVLPFSAIISSAQIAANTQHDIASAHRPSALKIEKKKNRKITVQYEYLSNVPDSLSKKIDKASQKLVKGFAIGLQKNTPVDSVYSLRTFTSYKSNVIGAPTQVLIEISCAVTHKQGSRKTPEKHYTISYRADANIYRIIYDGNSRKAKVVYNESYWPGYMYNDKAPTKAELNKDISLAMDHILISNVKLQ